ncbi:UPF0690 protein C1orf52 homolog [Chenopodium quinoa]|nr:UPF0690 protein C1orf52 homolog [Chenopodium quinoa]
MKRPWSDKEDESSSSSDTESEAEDEPGKPKSSRKPSEVKSVKRKSGGIDFEALSRHGYKGGLSVLKVPPPKEDPNRDWTWSTGKDRKKDEESEESYKERQKTRAALADGEELATAITQKEKKTFAQKEKRKRDLGQTSRGKNYVEEEKRMLRDSGVYSGFDC